MTETNSLLVWMLGGAGVLAVVLVVAIVMRGRQIAGEHVFRASRWSRGNHLFPTQVAITPESVVHHTPQWIGRREQSIHMAHVASVEVDTNLFFSNVVIETSGGSEPVRCYGHRKRDAVEMKRLINKYQSDYYGPNRQSRHV
jgi:hypothetical protein